MDMTALDFTIEHVPDVDLHGGKRYNSINHIRNAPALLPTAGGVSQRSERPMTTHIVISPVDSDNLKRCSKCGELKPRTEFNKSGKATNGGLSSWCKACISEQARQRKERLRSDYSRRIKPPADADGMRYCLGCNEFRPVETFSKDPRGDNGLSRRCSDCRRKTYEKDAESRRQYSRDYWRSHTNERQAYMQQYRAENADELLERGRAYNRKNADKRRSYRRIYRASHIEEEKARDREYRKRRPEVHRASEATRRAAMKERGGTYTPADIEAIRKAQGNRCYICGKKLAKFHVDHFIPLVLGGTNDPGNLRLACPKCNLHKYTKHPHDMGILI